jgi:hypothetical protein
MNQAMDFKKGDVVFWKSTEKDNEYKGTIIERVRAKRKPVLKEAIVENRHTQNQPSFIVLSEKGKYHWINLCFIRNFVEMVKKTFQIKNNNENLIADNQKNLPVKKFSINELDEIFEMKIVKNDIMITPDMPQPDDKKFISSLPKENQAKIAKIHVQTEVEKLFSKLYPHPDPYAKHLVSVRNFINQPRNII